MARSPVVILMIFLCLGFGYRCPAQIADTMRDLNIPIQLDSVVVKAGFDPKAFIRRVQHDTTFYKSFRSLHLVPFTANNSFIAFDKKGRISATCNSVVKQEIYGNKCRTDKVLDQKTTGDYYTRKGKFNYFTAELFDNLFYSKEPVCDQDDIVAGAMKLADQSRMEKSKYELKQLIFNPGSKVSGVPFMGDKASIFDEDELHKYDFKIRQEDHDGQECFVFSIIPKPDYRSKVVFDELITWFRRSDYSIVARNYSLSFSTLFYSFNVKMKVRCSTIAGKLYPVHIDYDGTWHVATKAPETVKVLVDFQY